MRREGLTGAEARHRLVQFGPNIISQAKRLSPVLMFLEKFKSPLLLVLIGAAILSYFLGEKSNAVIVLLMVLVSAAVDFLNSYHSEKAVAALEDRVATRISVIRDGKQIELRHADIVPGDLVVLEAGDVVPADLCLLEAKDFHLNEAALTGESFPVAKQAALKVTDTVSVTDASAAMMGTSVISGYGLGQVVATGARTQFGKIASDLSHTTPPTEFERGISSFSYFIMRLTLVMVIIVFFADVTFGRGVLDSFMFAVAIAIGLTPELLPVILSVSLARGSAEMAKRKVIVKKLIAIQNLGGMNVLCTDKTGTLTENKIVLVKWLNIRGRLSEDVLEAAYYSSTFHSGVVNPLDEAIKLAKKFSLSAVKKIDEVPFDFERKRSSVVLEIKDRRQLITKGSPDTIMEAVEHVVTGSKTERFTSAHQAEFEKLFNDLSNDGYRVLAIAHKNVAKKAEYTERDENDLTLLGIMAFLDPPKADAAAAIKSFGELGIEVKIITGDNEVLAKKICAEVGVPITGVVTGNDLSKLTDGQLIQAVTEANLFARINPMQKELIVKTLKQSGKVVGFLGDGINDAPAMKAADVGISVENAVNVAKEEADIILLRKSLSVLKDGVTEGRKTFRNTLKYILMGLSSNFGNVFSMAGASFFLPFLPMLPPQVLLNNFLYDMSQLSLSTDNVDPEEVLQPLRWNFSLIRRYMVVFGLVSSIFDALTFFVMYQVLHLTDASFRTTWFIESLSTQALVVLIIRSRKWPFLQSQPSAAMFLNIILMVGIAWLMPFVALGRYFHFAPLPASIIVTIVGIVILYLFTVELTKRLFYRRFSL